ncbi:MAG: phage tail tape measure protein [Chromatiales bacterium]|nr:phage tail tape measure protein [Chromatiales bacterium]
MRHHKTLDLAPGRLVTVREMRVRDMRHILAILTPETLERPVPDILQAHLSELLDLLADALQLPEGETIEDLTLSECEQIGRVWWEMHKDFFLGALGLGGLWPASGAIISDSHDRACLMLVEIGHRDVWDYGWSLYLTLLDLIGERANNPGDIGMSGSDLALQIVISVVDHASKDIEAVNTRVKQLNMELDRSEFSRTAEAMERFGTAVKNATQPMADAAKHGLAFAAAMTAVASALAGKVYQSAVSYESALLDLGKVLDGGREQAEQYGQQLNTLAEQYAQNGQELIGAMTNFVQAGYKAEEAFGLVEESIKMMVAGDMEATESAKNLISILKGFDAPASEAAHAVNLLNEVSNNYATDVKQLSNGMAALSPVAKQMGFTLNETAGLLTPIIEVYQSGAEAADALKVGLLKLTDDSKPVRQALEEIGVAQRDLNGNLRSGKEIFLDVARAFETLTDTQKLDLTSRLVGLEQAGRMSTVLGNLGKVMAVTETAANSMGSAMKEVETRLQSAQAQIDRSNERFRQLAVTLGNQFKTEITGVVAASGELAKAFDTAVQGGALEPLLAALRPQVAAIETLFRAMAENLGEALNGLDWSPLVEAIGDLSGEFGEAFRTLTSGMDLTTVEGLRTLLQSLINVMGNFTQYIAGVVDGMGPLFSSLNTVFGLMSQNWPTISNLIGQMQGLALSVNQVVPAISSLGSAVLGVIGNVVEFTAKVALAVVALRLLAGTGVLPFLGSLVMWFGRLNPAIAGAIAAVTGLSGAVGVLALGAAGLGVGLGLLLNKLLNLANEALEAKTGIDLLSNAQERAQKSADWSSNRLADKLREIQHPDRRHRHQHEGVGSGGEVRRPGAGCRHRRLVQGQCRTQAAPG